VSFARLLGDLTAEDMARLADLAATAPWREVPGRKYDTADVVFWEPCQRAFFIRVPPKGEIHRHHDAFIPGTTHHLVLHTNPAALNWWMEGRTEVAMHLEQGKRYHVDRTGLHWATNQGDTDRIHLLVEYA
jgi:aspartyl/asparaginyl beta-hydroxylase (cupin superfamily)